MKMKQSIAFLTAILLISNSLALANPSGENRPFKLRIGDDESHADIEIAVPTKEATKPECPQQQCPDAQCPQMQTLDLPCLPEEAPIKIAIPTAAAEQTWPEWASENWMGLGVGAGVVIIVGYAAIASIAKSRTPILLPTDYSEPMSPLQMVEKVKEACRIVKLTVLDDGTMPGWKKTGEPTKERFLTVLNGLVNKQ